MSHDLYVIFFHVSLAKTSDTCTHIPNGQRSLILPYMQNKRTEIIANNAIKYNTAGLVF